MAPYQNLPAGLVPVEGLFDTYESKTLTRRIAAEVFAMYRNARRRGRIVPRVDSVSVCHRLVSTSSARPTVRFVAVPRYQTRYHRREVGGGFLGIKHHTTDARSVGCSLDDTCDRSTRTSLPVLCKSMGGAKKGCNAQRTTLLHSAKVLPNY